MRLQFFLPLSLTLNVGPDGCVKGLCGNVPLSLLVKALCDVAPGCCEQSVFKLDPTRLLETLQNIMTYHSNLLTCQLT